MRPTILFAALTLAACTTDQTLQPSAPASSTPAANTRAAVNPQGQPVPIKVGEITGIPQDRIEQLRRAIDLRAKERNFELPRDRREDIRYTLAATIDPVTLTDQTIVNHRWTLTDADGVLRHTVALSDSQDGTSVFPGDALRPETLNAMATKALDAMRRYIDASGG